MSDFNGFRFSVITRTGTKLTATHLDMDTFVINEGEYVETSPLYRVDDVLSAGNKHALLRVVNYIGTLTWDGTALTFGAFSPLWQGAMYSWQGSAATSGDRTTLAIPIGPQDGIDDPILYFYPIFDGVVDTANPHLLALGANYAIVDIRCHTIGDNEFVVAFPERVLRRVTITDGVPAWSGNAISYPEGWSIQFIPGSRTAILIQQQFGSFTTATGFDLDTGAIGDSPLTISNNSYFWPLAGSTALGITDYDSADASIQHLGIRPVSLDGLNLEFAGDFRPLLRRAGWSSAGGYSDIWPVGNCVLGDDAAGRTDYERYDRYGGNGDGYNLSNFNLVGQAVGFLDGSGVQILDDMNPASDASQVWGITHAVELEPGVTPALAANYQEGRTMFSPV